MAFRNTRTSTTVKRDKNGTIHHHHHHFHTIETDKIGQLSGGFETFPDPASQFSITSGIQVVVGWIACLFSYVILGILIWIIVELST